jgi:hypothetical protein
VTQGATVVMPVAPCFYAVIALAKFHRLAGRLLRTVHLGAGHFFGFLFRQQFTED